MMTKGWLEYVIHMGKAILIMAWRVPVGSRRMRLPHFKEIILTKVVNLLVYAPPAIIFHDILLLISVLLEF